MPANGTATTTVTLTSTALDLGRHTDAVLATDSTGEVRLTTPVGLLREPPKVKLTIRTLGLDGAPADSDLLKLWYSTDDGANWKTATLKRDQDGRYTATANYPKLADTTGAVSLKVEACDADGNRIEQTTDRAFNLRG